MSKVLIFFLKTCQKNIFKIFLKK